jgi:simple sugar transport system permease protein
MGGALEAAARAGFNIMGTQFFIYGFVGFLSGIAGLTYGALNRQANPFDIVGSELDVIAAVVLGGAQLIGGRGTVIGTLLGVALVVIMNNSLILMGIPSVWQKVVIGLIIIIGTGIPAYQNRQAARRLTMGVVE